MTTPFAEAAFLYAVRNQGVPAGLRLLNERVPHRFTGIYRLQDAVLYCDHLYDKTGAVKADFLASVPLGDSFCQFVFRDGFFEVEDSAGDVRLDGHPYQGVVLSYHAVALVDTRGELYGSLCHLDLVPRDLPEGELAFLQKAARLLSAFVPVPATQG